VRELDRNLFEALPADDPHHLPDATERALRRKFRVPRAPKPQMKFEWANA
jgi:hypothetical protein